MKTGTYLAMPLVRQGDAVRFEEERRTLTPPADGEVTVHVKNVGVCGSDVGRWQGGAYHYPIVIGHEFSGEVAFDPAGSWTGRRVVVFPILPCRACEACRQELYAMCAHYDYYGSRRDGAFQEYLNVRRENLIQIPDGVSFEAAALCEPAAVALNGLKKAGDLTGKSVGVYGAGTIGILAVKIAQILGASAVFCSEPDAAKLAFAVSCGARPLTDGDSPDVYIDCCGAAAALNAMLLRARARAKIVLLGNAARDVVIGQKAYSQILRRELTLTGTWNSRVGKNDDWREVLSYLADGRLDLSAVITHRFSLRDAEKALETLASHKEFCEKVMLSTEVD